MRLVESVTICPGTEGAFTLDLTDYDEIRDEAMEFEDHTEFTISFVKHGEVVRRLWNPTCDIVYLHVERSKP